jgi:hypothetical protein
MDLNLRVNEIIESQISKVESKDKMLVARYTELLIRLENDDRHLTDQEKFFLADKRDEFVETLERLTETQMLNYFIQYYDYNKKVVWRESSYRDLPNSILLSLPESCEEVLQIQTSLEALQMQQIANQTYNELKTQLKTLFCTRFETPNFESALMCMKNLVSGKLRKEDVVEAAFEVIEDASGIYQSEINEYFEFRFSNQSEKELTIERLKRNQLSTLVCAESQGLLSEEQIKRWQIIQSKNKSLLKGILKSWQIERIPEQLEEESEIKFVESPSIDRTTNFGDHSEDDVDAGFGSFDR